MGYFLDIQSIFNLINGYQRNLFMKSWKYLNISMKAGCGQAWPWRARLPSSSATWLAGRKNKSLMSFLWKPIKARIFNCHVWLPEDNYSQYRKQAEWWFHGNYGLNIAWESRHQYHPPLESLEPNHSSEIVRITGTNRAKVLCRPKGRQIHHGSRKLMPRRRFQKDPLLRAFWPSNILHQVMSNRADSYFMLLVLPSGELT